jgi:two-component system response regulator VicR
MRKRALIVDDERAFADVLSELLRDEDYSVACAYDGLTALQMLAAPGPQPDVILCDVRLPALTGDRLAAEARRLYPHRRLPFVLLSASGDPRVRLRDVWFVGKPLDCADLLRLLDRAIERRPAIATL